MLAKGVATPTAWVREPSSPPHEEAEGPAISANQEVFVAVVFLLHDVRAAVRAHVDAGDGIGVADGLSKSAVLGTLEAGWRRARTT